MVNKPIFIDNTISDLLTFGQLEGYSEEQIFLEVFILSQ
jgi:hypothetical protein